MKAIIGFSDMLAEEDLTEDQKVDVDSIRESGRNLLHLIDDILDFSKIESGELRTEMIDCSPGERLDALESMMKARAEEKSLDFKIVRKNDLPAQIRTGPFRLHQCLTNLTNNALKFTEQWTSRAQGLPVNVLAVGSGGDRSFPGVRTIDAEGRPQQSGERFPGDGPGVKCLGELTLFERLQQGAAVVEIRRCQDTR